MAKEGGSKRAPEGTQVCKEVRATGQLRRNAPSARRAFCILR